MHRDLIVWQMITQLADRIMQMYLLRVCKFEKYAKGQMVTMENKTVAYIGRIN